MLSDFVEVGERLGDGFVTPNCFPESAQIGVSEGHACRRGVVCTPRGLWGREPAVWGNHTSHRLRTWTVNPRGPGAGEARGRDCKYYSNKKAQGQETTKRQTWFPLCPSEKGKGIAISLASWPLHLAAPLEMLTQDAAIRWPR